MPFKTGEPMGLSLWFTIYLFFTIGWGFLEVMMMKRKEKGKSDDGPAPYAGHHYQRRQVKEMLND